MRYDLKQVINLKTVGIRELEKLATAGDPDRSALFIGSDILSNGYERRSEGEPLTVSEQLARAWVERGTELDDPLCMAKFGFMQYAGIGGPKDQKSGEAHIRKSLEWLNEAAKSNHPYALSVLGVLHSDGIGVPESQFLAVRYFKQAIEREGMGEPNAMCNLGSLYVNGGGGIRKDYQQAVKLFSEPARLGHITAQTSLGFLNAKTLKNPDEAQKWFRRAADQGYVEAQLFMADWLDGKFGNSKPDVKEAFGWYQRVAERTDNPGDIRAALKVVEFLREGRGVTRDRLRAFETCLQLLDREKAEVARSELTAGEQTIHVLAELRALQKQAVQKIDTATGRTDWTFYDMPQDEGYCIQDIDGLLGERGITVRKNMLSIRIGKKTYDFKK